MPAPEKPQGSDFTPPLFRPSDSSAVRFQDPTFTIWASKLWQGTFQLTTVAGSAIVAKTAVAPLERVKIALQVHPATFLATQYEQPLRSAQSCYKHIVKHEGWKALWRGNIINALRIVPEVSLKFGVHDQLRVILCTTQDSSQMTFASRLTVGALTGLTTTTLLHPLSVLRTRLTADVSQRSLAALWPAVSSAAFSSATGGDLTSQQLHPRRVYQGILDCVVRTWQRERLAGFYGGFSLAAASTVPYLAVCFATYDGLSTFMPDGKECAQEAWYPMAKIGIAVGAAVTAQLAAYPLDTVRRRMEVNRAELAMVTHSGILRCARHMLLTEGIQSFYRGCVVNSIKTVPSAVLQFLAYDALKTLTLAIDPATAANARL